MPVILFVRHGENQYVKTGKLAGCLPAVHLNDKGRQQAQAAAEHLRRAPVKAVYTSPLERCLETAEPIAAALGLPIQPRPGLLEVDIGAWAGQSLKKLRRRRDWAIVQNAPSLWRFPDGESFAECQRRICAEVESICQAHAPQEMVVCVSHSDPIKLAVAYFIGLPLDSFQRLEVSTCSITALTISASGARLLALNQNSLVY